MCIITKNIPLFSVRNIKLFMLLVLNEEHTNIINVSIEGTHVLRGNSKSLYF